MQLWSLLTSSLLAVVADHRTPVRLTPGHLASPGAPWRQLASPGHLQVTAVGLSTCPALVLSASWRGELKVYSTKVPHHHHQQPFTPGALLPAARPPVPAPRPGGERLRPHSSRRLCGGGAVFTWLYLMARTHTLGPGRWCWWSWGRSRWWSGGPFTSR